MMGFTFVTDCASCSRLLSTSPRGNAVAGAFSAKRLNWLDEFSPHGFRVSESHLGSVFMGLSETLSLFLGSSEAKTNWKPSLS